MSLKILLCTNHFSPLTGGCEKVTSKIAEHLASRGYEVYVATRRERTRNASNYKNIKFLEYTLGDYRRFSIAVKSINPDVVFIYSDVFDFTRHIVAEFKCRIILALCGANWLYGNKDYVRKISRSTNLTDIICHSKCDRDYKLCSVSDLNQKVSVIPNGVDLTEFDNNHLSRQDLMPEFVNHKWILNVSNFFPGKGQKYIPDIISRLPDKWNYLYIQVSTDIDYSIGLKLEDEWNKQCSLSFKEKTNVSVKHLKNITRKETIGFFKNSNVFMFTSEKEVAPLVLLESMAAELPWVAADVGNALELDGGKVAYAVKDHKYQSVFDDRVKKLLAQHTASLLARPNGEAGRKQAESLTWDKILPLYADLIEKKWQK